eukprot:jgi/Bigna1/83602/fgenesh1_pg.111_\
MECKLVLRLLLLLLLLYRSSISTMTMKEGGGVNNDGGGGNGYDHGSEGFYKRTTFGVRTSAQVVSASFSTAIGGGGDNSKTKIDKNRANYALSKVVDSLRRKFAELTRVQNSIQEWSRMTADTKHREFVELRRQVSYLQGVLSATETRLAEAVSTNREIRAEFEENKKNSRTSLDKAQDKITALVSTTASQKKKYSTAIHLLEELHDIVKKEQKRAGSIDHQNEELLSKINLLRHQNISLIKERTKCVKQAEAAKTRATKMQFSTSKYRKTAKEKNKELIRVNETFRDRIEKLETIIYGRCISLKLYKRPSQLSMTPVKCKPLSARLHRVPRRSAGEGGRQEEGGGDRKKKRSISTSRPGKKSSSKAVSSHFSKSTGGRKYTAFSSSGQNKSGSGLKRKQNKDKLRRSPTSKEK